MDVRRPAPSAGPRSAVLLAIASLLLGFAIRDGLSPDWLSSLLDRSRDEVLPAPVSRSPDPVQPEATLSDLERMQLEALGYVSGVESLTEDRGLLFHDPDRASPGFNLVTSAHGEEALLLDMEGRTVHRWAYPSAGQGSSETDGGSDAADEVARRKWRKTHVYPNGDLLVVRSGRGILKLDRDSKLQWLHEELHHHDVTVGPDGRIYTLTRDDRVAPELNRRTEVGDDLVTVLAADGSVLRQSSIHDALAASEFAYLWHASEIFEEASSWDGSEDPEHRELFHTNAIQILEGRLAERLPEFGRGNLLLSLSRIHVVAVVDLAKERVVWARKLGFRNQHDPTVTDSGSLLLFDNFGRSGRSRVWEIDPVTDALEWSYGDAPGQDIYSSCCGTAQRLPNGNTLITETDAGRALEVTEDGTIVWEYVTPHASPSDPELVARIFEVERLPPEFGTEWLARQRPMTASR